MYQHSRLAWLHLRLYDSLCVAPPSFFSSFSEYGPFHDSFTVESRGYDGCSLLLHLRSPFWIPLAPASASPPQLHPAVSPTRSLLFRPKFLGSPICPRTVPTISGYAVVSSIGQRCLRHLSRFCPVLFAFFAHLLLSHRLLDLCPYFVLPAVPYLPPTTLSFSTVPRLLTLL